MKKKIINTVCLILALVLLIFCFAGCEEPAEPEQTAAPGKMPTARSGKTSVIFSKEAPVISAVKTSDGTTVTQNVKLAVPDVLEFMLPEGFDISSGEEIPEGSELTFSSEKINWSFVSSERVSDILKVTYEDKELGLRYTANVKCYPDYDGAFEFSGEFENISGYEFSFGKNHCFSFALDGAKTASSVRFRHEVVANKEGNNVLDITKKYLQKNSESDISISEKYHPASAFLSAIDCRKDEEHGVIVALPENTEGMLSTTVLEKSTVISADIGPLENETDESEKYALAGGEKVIVPAVYVYVYAEGSTKCTKRFEKWLGEVKFPAETAEAELLFEDDFDGEEIDEANWTVLEGTLLPEISCRSMDAVSVERGILNMNVIFNEETGLYEIGGLSSEGKAAFGSGYYEVSVRLPSVDGISGVFGMTIVGAPSEDGSYVEKAKAETTGSIKEKAEECLNRIQSDIGTEQYAELTSVYDDLDIYDGEFHRFAVWRHEAGYTFYIDGAKLWETEGKGVCPEDGFMMLTLETDLTQEIGSVTAKMEVDYVRVWDTNPYEITEVAE